MLKKGGFEAKALLKIRPFKEGFDEEAFVSIFNAVYADYDDIRSMTLEEMKKMQESPSSSSDGMFIAEWNGETAGMINAYVDKLREDEKGFIQWLGVLPKFRGKGIAKKLVEKALESLRQRGMKVAEAAAQTDREACMHIFESFGFKQVRIMSLMKGGLENIPCDIGENTEVTIRNMQVESEEDIELQNRLENEAFKEHYNFRPRTIEETKYNLFEIPWFKQQEWFLAVLGSQPLGYVGVGIDAGLNKEKNMRFGWILDIGVLKPHRRKRIGTSLMLHGMRLLKSWNMKEALLYVDDMNPTGAIKLYEKLGFEILRKNLLYQLQLT